MLVLMVLSDREVAENDEVMLVVDLRNILGHCRDLVASGVRRVCQQLRQRQQTSRLSRHLLAVDPLDTQNIGPINSRTFTSVRITL
jgi:hypothetical protein